MSGAKNELEAREGEGERSREPAATVPVVPPPYEPPEIEHLGSLRDLLGKSGLDSDGPPFTRPAD